MKYYQWVFEQYGIAVIHGLPEYPKLRKTSEVYLNDNDKEEYGAMLQRLKKSPNATISPNG